MNYRLALLLGPIICSAIPSAGDANSKRAGDHWSYRAPSKPDVPDIGDRGAKSNAIDGFIAAEYAKRGLVAVPRADKAVLLRRLYLDLVGVPPTRDELHAFLTDPSPEAYQVIVQKLLESPQYGERWGRHWMDVWRYSDWAGYGMEIRQSQRHIWRWRDWIVESLNRDKPYDQMIVEMLAGDEVAPTDPDTLRATGYLARSWFKYSRNVWLDGIVEHTSKAFLGITLNCARCHEHKYDPIEQEDYYRFRAFFEPHNIRTDRVPGQLDLMQDGVPRVFDAELNAPTYMFARGDEAQPITGTPLQPDVPSFLRHGELAVQPVSLPATAYYPGLQAFIRQETITAAEAALAKARESLDQANRAVGDAKQQWVRLTDTPALSGTMTGADDSGVAESEAAIGRAKEAARLAQLQLVTCETKLDFARARIAADTARFTVPPQASTGELARIAAELERRATLREAEEEAVRAEQLVVQAQAAAKPDDAKSKEAIAAAEKRLGDAREKLKNANAGLGNTAATYSPITEIYPATSSGRRLALARWIASRDNPLTARVAVNHIWMHHFSQPLVPTVFDFGVNGKKPSHPELLDWLALEFMEHQWSMKWLHRLIVMSDAYCLASSAARDRATATYAVGDGITPAYFAANSTIDPDNRLLWRQNPRRMEAETVRDSVLHVAGQLDSAMGGPDLDPGNGMTSRRRSIYFRTAHEKQMTFLSLFDQASVTECYRRSESVVPQQALALANSQLAWEQSRILARILRDALTQDPGPTAEESFVVAAYETVLGRPPDDQEMMESVGFLRRQAQLFREPAKLTAVQGGAAGALKPAMDADQRARENLVHVLLNHNEFVTIR